MTYDIERDQFVSNEFIDKNAALPKLPRSEARFSSELIFSIYEQFGTEFVVVNRI